MVPQSPEFHPGGHTVIHRSPHPPLPGFIPVPTMMPPPPRHMYSPVTGAGDMATQYMPQYQSSQVYADVGKISQRSLPCCDHPLRGQKRCSLHVTERTLHMVMIAKCVSVTQVLFRNFIFMMQQVSS